MRVLPQRLGKAKPSFLLLLVLVIAIAVQVSAVPADDPTSDTTDAARTTDDPSTTERTSTVSETTTSSTTSTSEPRSTTSTASSSTSTNMDETTTSSVSSTTSDDSTTTSVSTTTTSTSTPTNNSTIVTIPPIANAPYMKESSAPEGTVFIAVGAALGLIGLTLLAWRAMVAWSVNRSVRRAAVLHASENKRLLRGSRKKRSVPYSAAPVADVSLEKLGAATRASYKPNRASTTNSGLFFSPTAGGGPAGSHSNLHATGSTGNRGSTYLPAGYYAAASTSHPAASAERPYSPNPALSSPSLPPVGVYHDSHNQRQSYAAASTSSLNLNQAPQGRAPSAYLEDLFEGHVPHSSDSGRR